jgi:hypothetical protein
VNDATTLSNSGQQNFSSALGWLNMYGAWMTGEADVAETFPTRNEYGRRDIVVTNGSHSTDVWFPLSQAAASNHFVAELSCRRRTPTSTSSARTPGWATASC